MKILAIYPNADGYGRIPTGLAIIMTVLEKNGHELDLFDTTFLHDTNHDNDARESNKFVKDVLSIKVPNNDHSLELTTCDGTPEIIYDSLSEEEVNDLLLLKLDQFDPDAIIMSIVEDNWNWADELLQVVKSYKSSIPVIIGGPTPSAAPAILIENPLVDFLVQGEGEKPVVELCFLLEQNLRDFSSVCNLWYKKNGQVRNNPLRPFIDMETIPIQNVELWDRRHFYKAYDGVLYWTGYFEMSRGCPYLCTYCVNHTIMRSLKTAGKYFRRKSPHAAINEIKYHKEKYDLKRIVFCDDNFLLMPGREFDQWGQDFKDAWFSEINLPYWISTSVDFINPKALQFLADTGCDGIGLGVEAGGEWFRKNILKRRYTNEFMKNAFDMIHDYGIRTTANIMMGFPGEVEEDVFESIKLIRYIQPKSYDVSLVAPYVGTDIHSVSTKLKLIDTFNKPGFRGLSTKISFRQFSCIRNPSINPERTMELYNSFADYVSGKLEIPEKYQEPVPLRGDRSEKRRNEESIKVAKIIRSLSGNGRDEKKSNIDNSRVPNKTNGSIKSVAVSS